MRERMDRNLGDDGLDRLLDTLKAPPPSDLLRARLRAATLNAAKVGLTSRFAAADRSWRRAAFGRIAAGLVLAAGIGLGVWWPAPGTGPGPRAGAPAAAPVTADRWALTRDVALDDVAAEAALGLTLVGDGDAIAGGVGLVRAGWSGSPEGTAETAPSGPADDGIDAGLDAIPLD
ncbi:MAG: hypothetical protein R3229_02835 [Alphaproteobacteria bacterium]|nr:hypothetical protein [Alphaproteobacteria bacterium]